MEKRKEKVIATNRKAWHEYHVIDRFEAGIALQGTEVKSLRQGNASMVDSYAKMEKGEIWLLNCHIPTFKQGSYFNHEPRRKRKLLLHRTEIRKIAVKTLEKGFTLIPLKIYFSGPYVKVEIGLCRGKQQHDKRAAIKEKDALRDVQRSLSERRPRE
jgi:SsrA-binding protein